MHLWVQVAPYLPDQMQWWTSPWHQERVRRHETALTVTYASGVHLLRAYHNPCIVQMGGMSLRPNMKSSNLEEQIRVYRYHVRYRSWQLAFRKATTQLPIVQSQTKSAIAQMNGHGFVAKCEWMSTESLRDFQSPTVDGIMLRA